MNKIKKQKSRFPNAVLLFCFFVLGFWISGVYAQEAEEAQELKTPFDSANKISLDLKDANLKDVIKALSIQSGINFVASQEIEDRNVTLYLDKVSIRKALDLIFKENNLDYEVYEEINTILVKKSKPEIETITRIFPLKYASVSASLIEDEFSDGLELEGDEEDSEGVTEERSGITAVIERLLSPQGSIVEDARTNTLIITDLPNRFPMIEKTINELDVSVPQVMLEVEMLDVSKSLLDNLGFDFGDNPLTLILHGSRTKSFFLGDLDLKGARIDNSGVEGNVIMGGHYAGLLDFLKQQTDTRYLARPRILTLNNKTAEIKITTDEVIGEEVQYSETGAVVSSTAERMETGISLRITPQVSLETGEITMFLSPKVIEAQTSNIGDYRDPEERATNSLVRVRDGETVVAGGLIRNIKYVTRKKIPILGDIPILGLLFRHKETTKDTERELLVFITPHIVKDSSAPLAQHSSTILSSREQDISSTESRLLNIETTLNRFNVTQ